MRLENVVIKEDSDIDRIEDMRLREWLRDKYSNHSTQSVINRIFVAWFNWLQVNGDAQVAGKMPRELAKLQNELNRAALLDDEASNTLIFEGLRKYLESGKWTPGYKRKVYHTIRGYFDYVSKRTGGFPKLENGQKGILKGEKPVDRKEMEVFKGILREVVMASDSCHKAIYSAMAVSGMGEGEAVYWSNLGIRRLEESLVNPVERDGVELVEVDLPPRKQNIDKPYQVYVSGKPLEWLREWVKEREERRLSYEGKEPYPDSAFVTNQGTSVTTANLGEYWKNTLVRLKKYKIQAGRGRKRTGSNPHMIRYFFRTTWADTPAKKEFGEYFLGHFERYNYNQIYANREKRAEQYLRALPELDIWGERKVGDVDLRLKEKDKEIADLRAMNEANLRNIDKIMRAMVRDGTLPPEALDAADEELKRA